MGILTKIRDTLRTSWTPAAFVKGPPKLGRGFVVAEDLLTRMHCMIGPTFDHMFSGAALFEQVMTPVREAFRAGCYGYVMIADQRDLVPIRKHQVQMRRTKSAGLVQYPEGSYFDDGGIVVPGRSHSERFDLERVMHSRAVRPALWAYVMRKLAAVNLGSQGMVIFDHHMDGPTVYYNGRSCLLREHRHSFGESEVALVYWMLQFPDSPMLFKTTDTDLIPIIVHALVVMSPARRKGVYWMFKNKYGVHVDLIAMTNGIHTKLGMLGLDFMMAVLLCGSDYCSKKDTTDHVPHEVVFACVRKRPELVVQAHRDFKCFEALVCYIHSVHRKLGGAPSKVAELRERVEAEGGSRLASLPTSVSLWKAFSDIVFNIGYWGVNWAKMACPGIDLEKITWDPLEPLEL